MKVSFGMSLSMEKMQPNRRTVLVCAHDAGGANLLYHWAINAAKHINVEQRVSGPAIKIFNNRFKSNNDIREVDAVLTGTGWQSSFELDCIAEAKTLGVKVYAYLDHWVNYVARFKAYDTLVLPDGIWCADELARSVARRCTEFDALPVKIVGNYYWSSVRRELPLATEKTILVVHEPVRGSLKKQESLLQSFESCLALQGDSETICFRPHPSGLDEFGTLQLKWLRNRFKTVVISEACLAQDLSESKRVIGYLSMVLPMAASFGKKVSSFSKDELPDYMSQFGVQGV